MLFRHNPVEESCLSRPKKTGQHSHGDSLIALSHHFTASFGKW
jgi:hypothetical protein